jgi:dihydroneopterin aldolase
MAIDPMTQLALECRRMFLRDHAVQMQIGAYAFEKESTQRVVFNVELFVPYAQSTPHNDQLAEVVDYDYVREVIAAHTRSGHIELQETLCDAIAAQLLTNPRVRAVRLSSCKPDVYPDCSGVGVEVFHIKKSL